MLLLDHSSQKDMHSSEMNKTSQFTSSGVPVLYVCFLVQEQSNKLKQIWEVRKDAFIETRHMQSSTTSWHFEEAVSEDI